MEILLLGIYSFFVWLIFIKFKWLPWNIVSQVTVAVIPIVALTSLILYLNVVAPSSADVRVIKKVVQILPQVRGRVIEVPAEGNRPMKKGDVLFKVDPTPYQLEVNKLEAQLATAQASERELQETLKAATGKLAEAKSGVAQATSGIEGAKANVEAGTAAVAQAASRVVEAAARLDLAQMRVNQYRELVKTGAGSRFDLEKAETDVKEATAQLDTARAAESQAQSALAQSRAALAQSQGLLQQAKAAEAQAAAGERQVKERLAGRVGDELAQVAQIRAQLESARWDLSQTVTVAPANGAAINLQLRPGAFVVPMPMSPVMSFVEDEFETIALYMQNELTMVEPGNEAEIVFPTYPGRVVKAEVDSIVWAQGQGQLALSGNIPQTGAAPLPPGRFPVKLDIAERDRELFLAAGAVGHAAIFTHHGEWSHILRKVILRVNSYLNYLILKLH
jgi:multidrug resistance efflux pump